MTEKQESTRTAYSIWLGGVLAGDITLTLDDYRTWSAYDDNLVWRLQGGDVANLLEAAIEKIDAPADEHHTMAELYEFRMLYHAHAARGWVQQGYQVVKSHWHSDGEECFGGGWFIVTAMLPTGQTSNHYPEEFWNLFAVPEVALAPAWDGHSAADVVRRLRSALPGVDEGR